MAQIVGNFNGSEPTWASLIVDYTYSQNITENYTDVTARLLVRRNKGGSSTYKASAPISLSIAGETKQTSINFQISQITVGGTKEYMSFTKRIPHNNDGSVAACGIAGSINLTPTSLGSATASSTFTIPQIPRQTTITSFYVYDQGLDYADIVWTATDECDSVMYSLNGGAWISTSGSPFRIGGLTPSGNYVIKIRVKRADNQLWTESSGIVCNPYPVSTITSDISWNIGDNLQLNFNNPCNAKMNLHMYVNGEGDVITRQNIYGSSYLWTFTESEINALYQRCTSSTSLNIEIYVDTVGYDIKSKTGMAYTVRDRCKPSINTSKVTITDTYNIASGNYIRNKSYIRVSLASGLGIANKYASSIVSYTVTLNDITYTKTPSSSTININYGLLDFAGNRTLTVTAKDSRGYTSDPAQISLTMHDYGAPWFTTLKVSRVNGFESACRLSINASVFNCTGFTNNIQSITWTRRKSTSTSTDKSGTIVSGYNSVNYASNSTADFDICETDTKYYYKFIITDKLGAQTASEIFVNEGMPVLGIYENTTVGVASYVDDGYKFQVGGNAKINGTMNTSGNMECGGDLSVTGSVKNRLSFLEGLASTPTGCSWSAGHATPAMSAMSIRGNLNTSLFYPIIHTKLVNGATYATLGVNNTNIGFYAMPSTNTANTAPNYAYLNTSNNTFVSGGFVSETGYGWRDIKYGGGFYMSDTTYIRAFNDKSIYTGGVVCAGQYNFANGWLFAGIDNTAKNIVFCHGAYANNYDVLVYSKDFVFVNKSSDGYGSTPIRCLRETGASGRTIFRPDGNGGAYLGTTSYRWNTGFFVNTITQSDEKTKDNIKELGDKEVEFILSQTPVSYTLKNSDSENPRKHMGLLAQDVSKVAKDIAIGDLSMYQAAAVDGDGNEIPYSDDLDESQLSWGLNYNEFIAPLIKTVQYQENRINELEDKINRLEKLLEKVVIDEE